MLAIAYSVGAREQMCSLNENTILDANLFESIPVDSLPCSLETKSPCRVFPVTASDIVCPAGSMEGGDVVGGGTQLLKQQGPPAAAVG